MTLVHLLIMLVAAGVGLYVVRSVVPMDAKIANVITVVVTVVVGLISVLWLLEFLGIHTGVQLGRTGITTRGR